VAAKRAFHNFRETDPGPTKTNRATACSTRMRLAAYSTPARPSAAATSSS
jgi:hypothetical protein